MDALSQLLPPPPPSPASTPVRANESEYDSVRPFLPSSRKEREREREREREQENQSDGEARGKSSQEGSGGVAVPVGYPPRATFLFLAFSLSIYAGGVLIALLDGNEASNEFFFALAMDPERVALGDTYRLLSSGFLHAGLLHLVLNGAALWQVRRIFLTLPFLI